MVPPPTRVETAPKVRLVIFRQVVVISRPELGGEGLYGGTGPDLACRSVDSEEIPQSQRTTALGRGDRSLRRERKNLPMFGSRVFVRPVLGRGRELFVMSVLGRGRGVCVMSVLGRGRGVCVGVERAKKYLSGRSWDEDKEYNSSCRCWGERRSICHVGVGTRTRSIRHVGVGERAKN